METLARLESAFAALGGEYRARKAASEKAVCEWQWATSRWQDILPLYFERHGFAPGRRLKQEPANRRNRVACGLDRDGRMMVERQFNEIAFYETFYDWTADAIEAAHFDYADEKAPVNLMRARMRDNCIVAADKAAVHGYTREAYLWEDGRVVAVEVHHARREGGALAPLRPWHTARVHYGEDGVLMRVEHVWPAAVVRREQDLVEIMFERRGKTIYRNHP